MTTNKDNHSRFRTVQKGDNILPLTGTAHSLQVEIAEARRRLAEAERRADMEGNPPPLEDDEFWEEPQEKPDIWEILNKERNEYLNRNNKDPETPS